MPRGRGRSTGTEGQAYPNRTDLQDAPIVPGSTTYGEREELEAAASGPTSPASPAPVSPPPTPDDVPGMLDPSIRPGEPIQSGLAQGPGVGPAFDSAAATPAILAALYRRYPSEGLRELVEANWRRRGK